VGLTIPGYKPARKLAADRLGVLYLAVRKSDGSQVEIRILRQSLFESVEARQQFLDRAARLADLTHPGIVPVLDQLDLEGRLVLVHEHFRSRPFSDFLAENPGPISASRSVELLLHMLEPVDFAHQEGIVHGQIDPDHVLIDEYDHIKVREFGLVDSTGKLGLSHRGVTGSSLVYVAPERLLAKGVDQRSDVYSLGIMLYRLLTGRFPYPVDTGKPEEIEASVRKKRYRPPTDFVELMPPELSKVVLRAVAKKPSKRLASTSELRDLLRPFLRREEGVEERAAKAPPEKPEATKRPRPAVAKRRAKTKELVEEARRMIEQDRPVDAVALAREVFDLWPLCPELAEIISELEEEIPELVEPQETGAEIFEDIFEKELGEEVGDAESLLATTWAPSDPQRESELISTIRMHMQQNNFRAAAESAASAHREFPNNPIISELNIRLDKLFHPEKYRVSAKASERAATVPGPIARREEIVREPAPSKSWIVKARMGALSLLGALILVGLYLLVIKPVVLDRGAPRDEGPEPQPPQPYRVSMVVMGPESAQVSVEGRQLQPDRNGVYQLQGTDFGQLSIQVSADSFETIDRRLQVSEGAQLRDTLSMQPLGTGTVEVSLEAVMPEDEPQPEEGEVSFYVDGDRIEEMPVVLPTGTHVFRASLEGYRSVPETLTIDRTGSLRQELSLSPLRSAEIRLAIDGDIEGLADFYVDGYRVGSNRRRITYTAGYGGHTVTVRMPGRETWVRNIDLGSRGYSATVSPASAIEPGRLLIAPEPWAEVFVDGRSYGETPMPPLELEPGSYTVRLTNPDYQDQVHNIVIREGQDTAIRYTAPQRQEEVIPPEVISRTEPEYPGEALAQEDLSGLVTLYVTVSEDGTVSDVTVAHDGVGYGFAQAAVESVYDWRFDPATQAGEPVEATKAVTIPYNPPD
jgi:TonB family protein